MDAVDMYRGVLFELDRYESPEFDVEDFNWFIVLATDKWLKNELAQYELTQEVSDKISCLISTAEILFNPDNSTDVREANLPEDYRHLVRCLVKLRYKSSTPVHSAGDTRQKHSRRITGDGQAATMDNYYLRPLVTDSDLDLFHRVVGNKLSIMFDTPEAPNQTVTIQSATIEYFKKAPKIKINESMQVVTDTPFPEHASREIVKICADLFLENNGSQRLQSHMAIGN